MKKLLLYTFALLLLVHCSNTAPDAEQNRFDKAVGLLQQNGLLDSTITPRLQTLLDSCRKDTVNAIPGLLKASGKLLVLQLDLQGEKQLYDRYRGMYRKITATFPALRCDSSDMAYSIAEYDKNSVDTIGCEINLYSKGKRYFRDLGDGVLPYNKGFDDTAYYRLDPDFWRVFNTRLAAEKSALRLFRIPLRYIFDRDNNNRAVYREDPELVGLLLLNHDQYQSLRAIDALELTQDEFELFAPEKTEALFSQLLSTGLCGNPDSTTLDDMRQSLLGNSLYSKLDLYDFCDTLFSTLSFDTLNDVDPYSTMLQNLSAVSHHNFEVYNITELPRADSVIYVEYSISGNVYSFQYKRAQGLLDLHAFEDANIVLERRKAEGRFYIVGNTDESVTAVYIRSDQLARVKAAKLFDIVSEKVPAVLWKKFLNK